MDHEQIQEILGCLGQCEHDWVSGSTVELLPNLLAVIKILKVILGVILFLGDAC